jgi:hypothetical protein
VTGAYLVAYVGTKDRIPQSRNNYSPPAFHDPDYTDDALPAALRSGTVRVSRWMWWAWYGPLPARSVVLYRCDLPICVRFDHLAVGSQRDNLLMAAHRDRIAGMTSPVSREWP